MIQTKKFKLTTLAFLFALMLSGCTKSRNELVADRFLTLQAELDRIETSSQQLSAQNDDIEISLHHMVAEPDQLILDYTLTGSDEDILQSIICNSFHSNKNVSYTSMSTIGYTTEKNLKNTSIHYIVVCKADSTVLGKEDIGTNISLHFYSNTEQTSDLYIDCTIADIYEPKTTTMQQDINYTDGTFTFLSVTRHSCYSEITVTLDTPLNNFIFPQLYDSDGNSLGMLAADGEDTSSFWFMPFPEDSDSIQLEIAQAQKDGSYNALSDKTTISLH